MNTTQSRVAATHKSADNGHGPQSMIDLAELPPDLALMRIENDNIQAMATARPRDLEAVKADVLRQLQIFPAMAGQMIYSKPVGKDENNVQQFARNLSVRAAEMLAEAYGFNRVAAKTTIIDEDHAQVEATFVDYQRGRIWTESNPVSRIYKTRSGQTGRTPEDRFLNIVCKAERSKVIREAILRCVPPGLKQALFEAADKEMAKLLKPEHMQKIVGSFASKGVTLDQLERLIGRTQKQGWLAADRQRLAELWSAIENEEATVAEIFGTVDPSAAAPAAAADHTKAAEAPGRVTANDLLNPKGRATNRTAPASSAPAASSPPRASVPAQPQHEREPGEDDTGIGVPDDEQAEQAEEFEPDADSGAELDQDSYQGEAEPEEAWYVNLQEELAECTGIRDSKVLSDRYCGAQSPLTPEQKKIAAGLIAEFQERIRGSRGQRSNREQGTLI